jgi:hypothetical protein
MPIASPTAPPPAPSADYVSAALARAVDARGRRGAPPSLRPEPSIDRALALYVRRALAEDLSVEHMLAALHRLLRDHLTPHPDDDAGEVTALLLRRAITEYYR